ncbi:MAG: ribonuclease HII [Holophagae bacterium]|nr:MAG: ribonuclease HII [Holophagae bacterium]
MRRPCLGPNDRRLLRSATSIIGVDEVGRGCLAGPVVVCGVRFAAIARQPLVQDSKTLSARQREQAAEWVVRTCSDWVVLEVWVELIDRLNILEAVRLAMRTCVRALAVPGSVAVVDAVEIGEEHTDIHSPVRADATFFSVAAASIVAKVHRDRLMVELDARHPGWGWRRNKGYGTAEHRRALAESGRSYLHRKTFRWSPVVG